MDNILIHFLPNCSPLTLEVDQEDQDQGSQVVVQVVGQTIIPVLVSLVICNKLRKHALERSNNP